MDGYGVKQGAVVSIVIHISCLSFLTCEARLIVLPVCWSPVVLVPVHFRRMAGKSVYCQYVVIFCNKMVCWYVAKIVQICPSGTVILVTLTAYLAMTW